MSLVVLSVSENMADGASLCPQWQMSCPQAAVDVCTPILTFFSFFFCVPLLGEMSVLRDLSDFHIVHNADAQFNASSHTGHIQGLNVVC